MSLKTETSEVQLSEKARNIQSMFDRIAPRYDLLNRLLSMRQDVRWRKALAGSLPSGGRTQSLLDVACGTGDVMLEVLRSRPDYSQVWGLDLSEQMLAQAHRREAMKSSMADDERSVRLFQGTATALPFEEAQFHAVTISFGLRNVDDRQKALEEFARVLKPGGSLFVLEFFPMRRSLMSGAFEFYFRQILPLVGGLISDRKAYRYLPDSVSTMPSVNEFCGHLEKAGLVLRSSRSWLFGACRLVQAHKEF